jgi:hypothetical protein
MPPTKTYRQVLLKVYDSSLTALKVALQAGSSIIGKVRLVDSGGTEVTEAAGHSLKVLNISTDKGVFIGAVAPLRPVETPFTGTDSLVVATHKIAPAAPFELEEIELHLSAAPTTGTQNLVVTLDDGVAPAYDLVILTLDLVANAVTDLVIKPAKKCKAADVITAAWTNTDVRTYGLKFKHSLI